MFKPSWIRFVVSLSSSILLCALMASNSYAVTVTITGQDLINISNGAVVPSDTSAKLQQYVATQFVNEINKAGIVVSQGGVIYSGTLPFKRDSGCSHSELRDQSYVFNVDQGAQFTFNFNSVKSPTTLSVSLPAHGNFSGHYTRKEKYIPFPGAVGCYNRHVLDADFTAHINATLHLDLQVTLNPLLAKVAGVPQIDFSNSLVTLTGDVKSVSIDTDVRNLSVFPANLLGDFISFDFSFIANGIKDAFNVDSYLTTLANNKLNSALSPVIANAENALRNKIHQTIITLPKNSDQVIAALEALFQLPYLSDYIRLNADDLLYYAVIGDQQQIQAVIGSAAACEATHAVRSNLAHQTLYTSVAGSCVVADLDGTDTGNYFADAACSQAVKYRPTPYTSFCSQVLTVPSKLGVEKLVSEPSPTWTLAHGPRFNLGVDSITANAAPFMARTNYQNIGLCSLEMRVYKKDINTSNLKPLLALHGGSWKYRGFGYVGLESQISHLTEAGFIVFMPSYRLTGVDPGNASCGYANWQQITSDATYAVDWIKQNGALYGASNDKVAVFGQSAGAHLATYVVVNKSSDVAKGLLLYPPTDAGDFMRNLQNGAIVNPIGVESLQSFLGVNLYSSASLSNPAVSANSFPALVASAPAKYPPVFIIHGRSDTLVPSSQSVRLCNAYTGASDVNYGPALNDGGLIEKAYQCGSSQLHLVAQGEHALDFCLPGVLCPAGDLPSQAAVRDSLKQGRAWLTSSVLPLTVGENHVGLFRKDGNVWQWGGGTGVFAPTQKIGLSNVAAVSNGSSYSVMLAKDGTVWGWGYNGNGRFGNGSASSTYTPTQGSWSGIVAVTAGFMSTYGIKGDGTVWAAGSSLYQMLGSGVTTDQYNPVQVNGLSNVLAIAAGHNHMLALKNDGTVWAWGSEFSGEIGDGGAANSQPVNPVQVLGLTGVVAISAGYSHSLALKVDGTVWAWGSNAQGQLGGTYPSASAPVQIPGLAGVVSISASNVGWHSLAAKSDGTVWAWGYNRNGQLGDGTSVDHSVPVQVLGLSYVKQVAAGVDFSAAEQSDGSVWTWGHNQVGQLGDGTTVDRITPAKVGGLP